MLLHQNVEALEEAIRATANHFSLPVEYVEKDYWVTFALKKLADSSFRDYIVFKGGTSLSKAYRMISRFSEDVDIAVLTGGLTPNQTKSRVKKTSKIISGVFDEIDSPDTSKNSLFRKIRYQYPRIDDEAEVEGQITDSLLLEVNAFADPEPYNQMPIRSYIADFFEESGQLDFISEFNLESFEMNVLCRSRTLCEKIMGLVKASYGDNHVSQIQGKIRHLYDLHYLLQDEFTVNFIESEHFTPMIEKVKASDSLAFPEAPWLEEPISEARVFAGIEELWPSLEATYNGDFKTMVVGKDMPSGDLLINSIRKIYEHL